MSMPIVAILNLAEVIQKRRYDEKQWEASLNDKKINAPARGGVDKKKKEKARRAMGDALGTILRR